MNNKQNMPASSSGKRRLVGLDRWLLPALGTPWRPGRIFQSKKTQRIFDHIGSALKLGLNRAGYSEHPPYQLPGYSYSPG